MTTANRDDTFDVGIDARLIERFIMEVDALATFDGIPLDTFAEAFRRLHEGESEEVDDA